MYIFYRRLSGDWPVYFISCIMAGEENNILMEMNEKYLEAQDQIKEKNNQIEQFENLNFKNNQTITNLNEKYLEALDQIKIKNKLIEQFEKQNSINNEIIEELKNENEELKKMKNNNNAKESKESKVLKKLKEFEKSEESEESESKESEKSVKSDESIFKGKGNKTMNNKGSYSKGSYSKGKKTNSTEINIDNSKGSNKLFFDKGKGNLVGKGLSKSTFNNEHNFKYLWINNVWVRLNINEDLVDWVSENQEHYSNFEEVLERVKESFKINNKNEWSMFTINNYSKPTEEFYPLRFSLKRWVFTVYKLDTDKHEFFGKKIIVFIKKILEDCNNICARHPLEKKYISLFLESKANDKLSYLNKLLNEN